MTNKETNQLKIGIHPSVTICGFVIVRKKDAPISQLADLIRSVCRPDESCTMLEQHGVRSFGDPRNWQREEDPDGENNFRKFRPVAPEGHEFRKVIVSATLLEF